MFSLHKRMLGRLMAVFLAAVMAWSAIASSVSVSHAKGAEGACSQTLGPVAEGLANKSADRKISTAGFAELSGLAGQAEPATHGSGSAKVECCVIDCDPAFSLTPPSVAFIAWNPAGHERDFGGVLHGLWLESLKRPPKTSAVQTWRA